MRTWSSVFYKEGPSPKRHEAFGKCLCEKLFWQMLSDRYCQSKAYCREYLNLWAKLKHNDGCCWKTSFCLEFSDLANAGRLPSCLWYELTLHENASVCLATVSHCCFLLLYLLPSFSCTVVKWTAKLKSGTSRLCSACLARGSNSRKPLQQHKRNRKWCASYLATILSSLSTYSASLFGTKFFKKLVTI